MKKYSKQLLEVFSDEDLSYFDDQDIEMFSIDILKRILETRKSSKIEDERISNFWKEVYPKKTKNEKALYWAGMLFQSMRMQEESNQNPYSIYTESWFKETLKLEPNFIEMLPLIYNVWGGMFDSGKVDRIIKRFL